MSPTEDGDPVAATLGGPPAQAHYPPFVSTAERRLRWDLCVAVAAQQLGEPPDGAQVWSASRVLFHSAIPTSDAVPAATPHRGL